MGGLAAMASRLGRRQQLFQNAASVPGTRNRLRFRFSSRRVIKTILICLALLAILPPLFFHFRLRRLHQMQLRECAWLNDPPLVCAHGGDSSKAFPNTIAAYVSAIHSQVDCIEIDVSRSSDGVLFALHDRDLQRISGNTTSKVGHLSASQLINVGVKFPSDNNTWGLKWDSKPLWKATIEIRELNALNQSVKKYNNEVITTIEEALKLTANSVRHIILDAKVGPPLYEKGLARDILSAIGRTDCGNCLVWAKSDSLARDVLKLSSDVTVGYIVMKDPSTGARTNLLRIKDAEVVGVYHPLIDEKLVKVLHRRKKRVYAWTVDDEESMQRMLSEHVEAIVTSNPTLLQRVMQDARTRCLVEGYSLPK